jgi:hypothetical protein
MEMILMNVEKWFWTLNDKFKKFMQKNNFNEFDLISFEKKRLY